MTKELVEKLIYNSTEETFEEKKERLKMKLITGGNDGNSGNFSPNDWLSPLEDGTMFLFKDKTNRSPFLGQATILARTEKAIYLGLILNGQPRREPVDPSLFCSQYSLYENQGKLSTLEEANQEPMEPTIAEENNNGTDPEQGHRV